MLTEGYDAASLHKDLVAALTVAVVALPLSMAIAVASGVSPASGVVFARQCLGRCVLDMVEKREFANLLLNWRTASVLLLTFGMTILKDLSIGVITGCILAAAFAAVLRPIPSEGNAGLSDD